MNPKEYLAISDAYKKVYAEETLQEKQKDTPDQVKAVIAYDKARKGTDDATYDSEHGDKKQAKKERDYAKWQRDQGAEFAQKSGHRWKHAPGSTREKEGEKSVKHAEVKDSYQPLTSRDQQGLSDAYRAVYGEDRKYGYDKAGNSLNPVDIEKRKRKEDDLFGSPKSHNKSTSQGQRMGGKSTIYKEESQAKQEISDLKKAAKTLKGKYVAKADKVEEGIVKESGWHRRNPEKVGTPADPDTPVLKGSGKVKTYAQTKKENPPTNPKRGGVYKPDKDGKMVRQEEVVLEKDLSAAERRALPDKDFALPGKGKGPQGKQAGSYPIPDATHARMALAMVAKHGTPEEKATVRAKVAKKFPDIKQEEVEVVDKLIESGKFSNEEILRIIQD